MRTFWNWIQGKKTSIATIAGAVLVYALNNGAVSADQAQLISVILAALGITSNAVLGFKPQDKDKDV